jgi:transmembrane sensor
MSRSMNHEDLAAEASYWVAVSRSDAMTADERAAMEAWLQSDARHTEAFAQIERIALSAASLKSLAALEPRSSKERRRPWKPQPWGALNRSRRPLIAAAAIAASGAVAVLFTPQLMMRPDMDVTTSVAQTRVITLADRTRVTLGPKSHVKVHFSSDERSVELASGEAFFEVTHDVGRPFIVKAGDIHVRVLGTKFDVNHNPERVGVNVLEGVVQVRETAPLFSPPSVHIVRAGQRVETQAQAALLGHSPATSIVASEVPAGEWRGGRLVYANSRLGDVVADLNRYYGPGIRLDDSALADARIATTFMPNEIATFFANLPIILPVTVSRTETGEVTISKRPAHEE